MFCGSEAVRRTQAERYRQVWQGYDGEYGMCTNMLRQWLSMLRLLHAACIASRQQPLLSCT